MAIFSGKIICYERSPENLRIFRASLFTRGAVMIQGIYCQKCIFSMDFSGEKVFGRPCDCKAMKAPVGLSSRRAVCASRWKGLALTSVENATNTNHKE